VGRKKVRKLGYNWAYPWLREEDSKCIHGDWKAKALRKRKTYEHEREWYQRTNKANQPFDAWISMLKFISKQSSNVIWQNTKSSIDNKFGDHIIKLSVWIFKRKIPHCPISKCVLPQESKRRSNKQHYHYLVCEYVYQVLLDSKRPIAMIRKRPSFWLLNDQKQQRWYDRKPTDHSERPPPAHRSTHLQAHIRQSHTQIQSKLIHSHWPSLEFLRKRVVQKWEAEGCDRTHADNHSCS